jgi:hypothetical protein
MIQVSIKRSGQLTNQASFPTMEEAQAWLSHHEGMKSFGKPAQTIQQEVELSPAVIDEEGNELSPAVMEMQEVHIPGSYEVEVLDITSQLEQEQINAQAKQFLNDTDKLVIRHRDQKELSIPTKLSEEEFQALLVERQAARDRIVK